MNKEIQNFSNPKKDLLLIIVAVLIGFVISQFIGGMYILIYNFFSDNPLKIEGISSIISNSNMRTHFLVIQSFTSLIVFFLAPYIYLRGKKEFLSDLLKFNKIQFSPLIILFFATICFMLFNGLIIEWNKNIELPSFFSSFEEYAKNKELELEKLTLFLVSFENFNEYLLGIIAVAIIPAFCEEYLFRGVIQKKLELIFKNIHVAIFLSSFVFSFFHFQFYGLIPRMLLGVLFGYFYYFSNNLSYPIIAHFINNFSALTLFYFSSSGIIDLSVEDVNNYQFPFFLSLLLLAISLCFIRLFYLNFLHIKKFI